MKRVVSLVMALGFAASLAGCVSAPPPPPPIYRPPPPPPPPPPPTPLEEFSWSQQSGDNVLVGEVLFRPAPGETWSCAGQAIALTPETSYSRSRMITLYGSAQRAIQPVEAVRTRSAANPGMDYARFVRSTTCDSQNGFGFRGLPDGAWFIIARVRQTAPAGRANDGAVIMQRVELRDGQTVHVTLPTGQPPAPPRAPGPRTGTRPLPRRTH